MNTSLQLVQDEQRFRSLFENNPDLVLFQNATGTILDANQAFLAHINKPKEQVLHRPLSDFLPPDKRPLFQQKLLEAFRGKKVRFETDVKFDGLEPRRFDITKVPLMDDGQITGIHAVFRDITAVAAAQLMVQKQAQKLHTVFESITDAFFLVDHNWHFTYLNSEVERLLNVQRDDILGLSVWDVFPEEANGVFYQHYTQAISTGQAVHFEGFFERLQMWFDVKAFPSEEGLSVYFSDVTDRVKAHEELYRQNNDLQQFTYIVSHNLRGPLANIMGLVDLLSSAQPASYDFEQIRQHLQLNTHQLDAVLQDMNTILTIRDNRNVVAPEQVLLLDVIEQARRTLEVPLAQCGGSIRLAVPPNVRVHGNRAYLYSIFFNLLSNSIKYRADARPLQVEIESTVSPEHDIVITFADNGSGFDLQKAGSDVFKLYKRFHSQHVGRGMGLYLVKTHVEAMGGHIAVSSHEGVGTRFTIHLR
ncbi:PAS domain-containing sensor histidine kinase [Hymenobacter sp. BT186]|uniref:histidine kinase n=1 Tax=Hymenobacter telluris TaxID=2816474 RepID=A0A939ETK0_9BACT|nr:PAS domain-containing sensor histidine kinase [Hymenobacter telluris]MBO0356987.1 PAS domain-containing sensor histidine kinase [Hymenobacter telluris]MBW3373014.1 PAS domain-containing sensor histidine kinase [Hymenobacter norwichensis]